MIWIEMLVYISVVVFLLLKSTQFSLCDRNRRPRWGKKTYRQSMSQGWFSDIITEGYSLNSSTEVTWYWSCRAFTGSAEAGGWSKRMDCFQHRVTHCVTWNNCLGSAPMRHSARPNFSSGIKWRVKTNVVPVPILHLLLHQLSHIVEIFLGRFLPQSIMRNKVYTEQTTPISPVTFTQAEEIPQYVCETVLDYGLTLHNITSTNYFKTHIDCGNMSSRQYLMGSAGSFCHGWKNDACLGAFPTLNTCILDPTGFFTVSLCFYFCT